MTSSGAADEARPVRPRLGSPVGPLVPGTPWRVPDPRSVSEPVRAIPVPDGLVIVVFIAGGDDDLEIEGQKRVPVTNAIVTVGKLCPA
ncbi:MAG: hypothetical protein ABIZ52_08580, partial [Candidatus Limnocylindrales bacterium]